MDAALRLSLAFPSAGSLVLARRHRRRRVPVPHGLVAPVQQLVVRDVVLRDVRLDLGEGPVYERVDFYDAGLVVYFEDADLIALAPLRASPSRQNGGHVQFGIRPLLGFDLGNPVVKLGSRLVELLAIPLLELGGGVGLLRLIRVDPDVGVSLIHSLDQGVCLVEVVQRVEEDKIDRRRARRLLLDLGEHVCGYQAGEAEGGGLIQIGKADLDEAESIHG